MNPSYEVDLPKLNQEVIDYLHHDLLLSKFIITCLFYPYFVYMGHEMGEDRITGINNLVLYTFV
jgi:hypothetical protein